jgi:thiamine biosynthesis lipoprotein
MIAGLPIADPQFWIVTATVAIAVALAVRRVVRSLRRESARPCASCSRARAVPSTPWSPRWARPRLPVVALVAVLAPVGAAATTVERQVEVMGTTLRVEVEGADRTAALAVAESLLREVEATERRLSTWRDDSELAALNAAPAGTWRALSAETFAALAGAWSCAERTGGAFDPTLAPLVAAWGLRTGGRLPSATELAAARAATGPERLALDAGRRRVGKRSPVTIDEGAFGKGAALDAALAADSSAGFVRIDLGGQLAWRGAPAPQTVALADPRDRGRPALDLTLAAERGSLATSGDGERRFAVGGETFGHLLDPRTGRPARDFGSVVVAAASGLEADCLSTALFVLGPERGARWLAGAGRGVEAVYLVVESGRLRALATAGLAGGLRPRAEDIEIEILESSS